MDPKALETSFRFASGQIVFPAEKYIFFFESRKFNILYKHPFENSLSLSHAYMHQLTKPPWVQVLDGQLLSAKTLSKPRMALVDLTHGNKFQWNWNQNTVFINTNQFYSVVCKWQPICLSPGLSSKHHLFICTTVVPSILLILKKSHHETFIHVFTGVLIFISYVKFPIYQRSSCLINDDSSSKILSWLAIQHTTQWNAQQVCGQCGGHYNTPMWHFGPYVTFQPCQCHFLDLPMSLFGPEAVPCRRYPPPGIKKSIEIYQKLKRTIKINFNDTNNRRNTQTQEPRCFPCIQHI